MFEYWVKSDLQKPLYVEIMKGALFSGEGSANKIGVEVYNNGAAATLTGTVKANVITPTGTTEVNGTVSGNKASVVLPSSAYANPGRIGIFIKLINNSDITTLCGVEGYVYRG